MQYFSLGLSYDASNFGYANFHSNNPKNDIHILWPGLQKLAKGGIFKYVCAIFWDISQNNIYVFAIMAVFYDKNHCIYQTFWISRIGFYSPKLCLQLYSLRYETSFTNKCYYGFGIEYRIYWCRGKENCLLKIQLFANFFLPISIHKMQKVQHADFYAIVSIIMSIFMQKKSIKWCIQSICIPKTIPLQ